MSHGERPDGPAPGAPEPLQPPGTGSLWNLDAAPPPPRAPAPDSRPAPPDSRPAPPDAADASAALRRPLDDAPPSLANAAPAPSAPTPPPPSAAPAPSQHYYAGQAPPGVEHGGPSLADQIPGAVPHTVYDDAYARANAGAPLTPQLPTPTPRQSGWNAPAFGMLAIFLMALAAVGWPQIKARQTEATVRPLVAAISERNAGARCPRYITAFFGNAGSVTFDEHGNASDRTDLTAPVCDGAKYAFTPAGRNALDCLITDGNCSPEALKAVVALNVIAHEAIHLRGETDESRAECFSIGEGARIAQTVGLTPEHGKMIAWAHYRGMNQFTPARYHVSSSWCAAAAQLEQQPPLLDPALRDTLSERVGQAWVSLGE